MSSRTSSEDTSFDDDSFNSRKRQAGDAGSPETKRPRFQQPNAHSTFGGSLTDSSDDDRSDLRTGTNSAPAKFTGFCQPKTVQFGNRSNVDSKSPENHTSGSSADHSLVDSSDDDRPSFQRAGAALSDFSSTSLRKTATKEEPQYGAVANKLMAKMGFKAGQGLGKNLQGRTNIVEASMQKGRRGVGTTVKGFEQADVDWDFEREETRIEEHVDWLPTCTESIPDLDEMLGWVREGPKKREIDDEAEFCSPKVLAEVLNCKSVFDNLEGEEMRRARTKSNPYETIRGVFFLNRAAMKMANMDAVTGFMFTSPRDNKGNLMVKQDELLYFADICAGPGGFSEYVLWRKKWEAKGFGFTLKGPCDFKLEDFFAASSELFEPYYGVGGVNGDGDIYRSDNQESFRQFVWESTGGAGLHFVMADGGFSVEGQENIQEVLSKRLYLCQFLVALSVLREGGNFVCKLFDIFTPFSVGLIYLMYRAFTRVAIFKCVTSRPANSERYIVCQNLRPGSHQIHDYMFEINKLMEKTFSSTLSDRDIVQVVPLEIMRGDIQFNDYIINSNETLGKMQAVSLVKIQTFAQNSNLQDPRQAEVRKQCLEAWEIPDEVRTAPERSERPETRYNKLLDAGSLDLQHMPIELVPSNLQASIHGLYDYRCVLTGADKRWFIFSMGRTHVWKWDGRNASKWVKVDEVKLELPRDTLIEAEFVMELRGEGRGQRRVMAVHILDALLLGGIDVQQFHYKERLQKLQKFVKAIHRPSRIDVTPVRVKDVYKLEDVSKVFDRLAMKLIKGSGARHRLCYQCGNPVSYASAEEDHGRWTFHPPVEQPRFISPTGLMLIKTEKDPWMLAFSRSKRRWYWYNSNTREALFEPPKDCIGDYSFCHKSRLWWKWEEGVKVTDLQTDQSPDRISKDDMLRFVNKLRTPY